MKVEDNDHVFDSCDVASRAWSLIASWLDIDFLVAARHKTLMELLDGVRINTKKKRFIEVVVFSTWWVLWRYKSITNRDDTW